MELRFGRGTRRVTVTDGPDRITQIGNGELIAGNERSFVEFKARSVTAAVQRAWDEPNSFVLLVVAFDSLEFSQLANGHKLWKAGARTSGMRLPFPSV